MLSLVLLTGYGGHVSLAQLTFAGVGALAYAKLDEPNLYGLLVSALIAAGVGALVALPVLRLTGLYLALATLAFAVAHGQAGLPGRLRLRLQRHPAAPSGSRCSATRSSSTGGYVFVMAVFFVLMALGACCCSAAACVGRLLIAMRDSPAACGTLGLDMRWFRVGLFALSAGHGRARRRAVRRAAPDHRRRRLQLFNSLLLLLLAVVCGVTSVTGAALGGVGADAAAGAAERRTPSSAGLVFVVLGVGAVAARPDPNGLANQLFRLGRWLERRFGAGDPRQPARRCPAAGGDSADDRRRDRRPARGRPRRCRRMRTEPLLEVDDVVVQFGGVTAVNHASLRRRGRPGHRPDRPQRRRQDHLLQRDQRAAEADPRQGPLRRPQRHPARRCTAAPSAGWAAPSSGWRRSAR